MPPKKVQEPEKKPLIGRVGTNLRVGIVGVPNVGKSTFFNVLTKSSAAAENFPFCTIDPNENNLSNLHQLWCQDVDKMSTLDAFSTMFKNYTEKYENLRDFVPDQTIIFNEKYLTHLYPFQSEQENSSVGASRYDQWYPFVNSYYSFTEDVDAYARVNHLVGSHPSMTSSSSLFGAAAGAEEGPEILTAPNTERQAHTKYVNSKPVCFLILGKPEIGQENLGRRLANYWKCLHIDPQTLLEEEIASGSRAGQCIEFNLRCGRAIGVDVILRLLADKVQSPSARHRGYVISGFPLIPNDLYEEDPISSESAVFNVKDIFEDIIDQTIDALDISMTGMAQVSLSSRQPSEASMQRTEDKEPVEILEKFPNINLSIDTSSSLLTEICVPADIASDSERQINCLFGLSWDLFIIIYLACENKDVTDKRNNTYFDIYSKKTIDMQKMDLFFEIGGTNEYLSMDVLDPAVNPLNENPNLRHLTRLPINLTSQIATQLDRYHTYGQSLIDRQILLHDVQYYIRLDGRAYLTQMLDIIKMRLKVLPLQRVLLPERLTLSFENEELGEGRQEPPPPTTESLSLEETFQRLCKKQIVGPEFRWSLSNWNYLCPVNMKRGNYVKGDPKYAVQFMTKIFFLADYGSYLKFLENPRSFLRAPFPKPSCRMLVFGPPLSGKTTVSRTMGFMYDGQVFNPKDMSHKYLAEKTNELKEKHRRAAMIEGFKLLESQKKDEYNTKVEEQKKQKQEWKTKATKVLNELLQTASVTSKVSIHQSDMSEPQIDQFSQQLRELNLPTDFDEQLISKLLENENELFQYLPEHLTVVLPEPSVSISDPFVIEFANQKVSQLHLDITEMTDEYLLEMYVSSILSIQRNKPCNGWIVDDATVDIDMLQQICEHCKVDNVIILETSDDEFLIERSMEQYRYQYSNYKNFFMNMGEVAAAWRCPSAMSTASYKHQVASQIIRSAIDGGLNEQEKRRSLEYTVDAFKQTLTNYSESIKQVRSFFENLDCQVYTVDVNGLDSEQLMLRVIQMVQDNYRVTAVEYTDKDRAEDVQEFLAGLALDADEGGEGNVGGPPAQDWKETFESQRRYGYTNVYCPVTFFEKFVLWRGKEDCAARFNNKLFLMSSRKDLETFLAAPRYFTNGGKFAVVIPPPRICVVGVPYSGKTTIAKLLARNLGVRYASYDHYSTKIGRNNEVVEGSSGNIVSDDNSEEPLIEDFMTNLWFREPTKSIGFVLDGFPRDASDVDIMIRIKAIPDYVIWLVVDEEINRGRLLTKMLDHWRLEQEEKRRLEAIKNDEILKEWEELRKARYNELMDVKRQARYLSKLEDIAEDEPVPENDLTASKTQVSFDSVEDQEDIDEVMEIIDGELPEPMLFDETEDEQEAIAQFTSVIDDKARKSKTLIEQMKEVCQKELIPWTEIDGNTNIEKLAVQAFRVTDDIKFRNESFFEQCFIVSVDTAEKLLNKGYVFLSRFGKTCPVQCYENEVSIQLYLAAEKNNDLYPIIHRQYIYFICGRKSRDKFIKNPLIYIRHSFNFPLVPFRVGIIGPPKCGKTKLATRFGHEYAFETLSRGQAIRYTLDVLPLSNLAKSVESILRKGEELPDQLVVECVHAASFVGAITQGLVFDGFPNTINEVNLLARYGLVPHSIIDLQATDDELLRYSQTIPIKVFPIYSERFTNYQLIRWRKDSEQFRVWCQREYQNIEKVSVSPSIWGVWNSSRNIALKKFTEIKHYYQEARSDQALSIACMLITPLEFLQRQSSYKSFCPVCLRFSKSLRTGGEPPDRTGLVHFREHFYWVCSDHLHVFMETPEDFTPLKNDPLPDDLPTRVTLTEWPENVYESGTCMVCLSKHRPDKVVKTGVISFAISYVGQIYLFDTEDCLVEFLRDPHLFSHLTVTFRNLPDYPSLKYDELPILGYLEQYIAQLLVKAVNHIGVTRPLIPCLSISTSACIGIGLHLKANCPQTSEEHQPLYKEALEDFHNKRKFLLTALDRMKQHLNPHLSYAGQEFGSTSSGTSGGASIMESLFKDGGT